jgi:hypothetical protein
VYGRTPPLAEAIAAPVACPLQMMAAVTLAESATGAGSVTDMVSDVVHPAPSVAVTE